MKLKTTILEEILDTSSQLEALIDAGSVVLRYPVSLHQDGDLHEMKANPKAVDYIVKSEHS